MYSETEVFIKLSSVELQQVLAIDLDRDSFPGLPPLVESRGRR
jgi:hypothetical protein